jgi:DNA replication and repair protein RecF
MELNWLHILNFKNWEEKELSFEPGITCLVGPNGRGKTNLLDAIYYLCFTRSFLNTSDTQNIRLNDPFFMLEGRFTRDGTEEHVQVSMKKGQKKTVRRNKKEYEKLADHIGLLPAVMVCPQYISIITGSSEERRRWLDMLISQFDHVYLQSLISYQRVLQQRNSLIRQMSETNRWDEETLSVYDQQLNKYGHDVYTTRIKFIEEFTPVFEEYYQMISNGSEKVGLELISHLNNGEQLISILQRTRAKDRSLQYTSSGIHKDDLEFTIHQMNVKKFGSQGQQKSFLMALKLAEHHFLSLQLKSHPLLMLDDVFDKLDEHRVKQVLKKVSEPGFGQVFITDTGATRLKELLTGLGMEAKFYDI